MDRQYRGVSFHRIDRRWRVQVKLNQHTYWVGNYRDPVVAARVWDAASLMLKHPSDVVLNFDGQPPPEVPLAAIRVPGSFGPGHLTDPRCGNKYGVDGFPQPCYNAPDGGSWSLRVVATSAGLAPSAALADWRDSMPADPAPGDPPGPPKTTDPPPAEPPKVVEPPKTPDPPRTPDPPPGDPPESIPELFDRLTGRKTAEKYADNRAWADGVDELMTMAGRRDADAVLGREFRGKEDQIRQFLSQQAATATANPLDDAIKSFDPDWITTDGDGRIVATAGARTDVEDRHRRYQAALGKRLDQLIRDPDAFFSPHLEKAEQRFQEQQQQQAAQQEQAAVTGWIEEHKDWLFVGGDTREQLTAAGKKLQQLDVEMAEDGMSNAVKRLEIAAQAVRKQQPSLKGKGKPGGKASHQPAVAAAPPTEEGIEELFAKQADGSKLSLAEILKRRHDQRVREAE